jgi:hypothetical protein
VDVLDLDHAESEVDREMVDPNADQPIQTLLNRPYFRRMWVRSILFIETYLKPEMLIYQTDTTRSHSRSKHAV